jgi:hypothetical protein
MAPMLRDEEIRQLAAPTCLLDISLGDLDGDGDLDAFVANGMRGNVSSAVWLNDGLGAFSTSEQNLGYGMGPERACEYTGFRCAFPIGQ